MMILAYDSSSEVLSLALFDNDKKIGELDSPLFTRHSATLAPSLDILLKAHKMKIQDVDVFAVGLGPGSFTGLRVGVTTAKVLAYALDKKIVGVSSLEALAYGVASNGDGMIAVILDAKKGKLYAALYENRNGKLRVTKKPALANADTFFREIKKPTVFVGDGIGLYRDRIQGIKRPPCRMVEEKEAQHPKASHIAQAAFRMIKEKKFANPFDLEPMYLHARTCNVVKK